jgi:hypothetical protein
MPPASLIITQLREPGVRNQQIREIAIRCEYPSPNIEGETMS